MINTEITTTKGMEQAQNSITAKRRGNLDLRFLRVPNRKW